MTPATTGTTATMLDALYRGRTGRVDIVDVPEVGAVVVAGCGRPQEDGGEFQDAVRALFAVSHAARAIVKETSGEAFRVMPLEALWWVAGPDPSDVGGADDDAWRWRAFIVQPPVVDSSVIARAVDQVTRRHTTDLRDLRYERWREGRCAQTLQVGPYDEEGPAIELLHAGIERAGCRPRGSFHEIYLSDPRRTAAERLRTLLRRPIEPDAGRRPG